MTTLLKRLIYPAHELWISTLLKSNSEDINAIFPSSDLTKIREALERDVECSLWDVLSGSDPRFQQESKRERLLAALMIVRDCARDRYAW